MAHPTRSDLKKMLRDNRPRQRHTGSRSESTVRVNQKTGEPIIVPKPNESQHSSRSRPEKQPVKREPRPSEIRLDSPSSIEDQFVDNQLDFERSPEYSTQLLKKSVFNHDSEIGQELFMSQVVVDELEKMSKHARLASQPALASKLQAECEVIKTMRPPHGISRWALNDEFVEEAWDPNVLLPLFTSSAAAADGPIDTRITPFDTETCVIKVPVLCEHVSTNEVMSRLREALNLPFTPLRHSLLPSRMCTATTVDYSVSSLQSVLIAFDEPFASAQVQNLLAKLANLFHLHFYGGNIAFIGTPRIVRLADRHEEGANHDAHESTKPETAVLSTTASVTETNTPEMQAAIVVKDQPQIGVQVSGVDDFEPDLSRLPDLTYNLSVRHLSKSAGRVSEKLFRLAKHGFINYTASGRHGFHLSRSFRQGRRVSSRDLLPFVSDHIRGLSEGFVPLQESLSNGLHLVEAEEAVGNADQIMKAWGALSKDAHTAIADLEKHARALQTSGINPSHPAALKQCLDAITQSNCDYARVVRASVHRHVLIDHLTSLSDVHWNALATLRMRLYGSKVVPGDVVCEDPTVRWDVGGTDIPTDYVPSFRDAGIPRWGHRYCELDHTLPPLGNGAYDTGLVKLVQTEEEAKQYDITDVLLPKLGRPPAYIQGSPTPSDFMLFPAHKIDHSVFSRLHNTLSISGISSMKLAPFATYRRLVVKPRGLSYAFFGDSLSSTSNQESGPRSWAQPLVCGTFDAQGNEQKGSAGISTYVDNDGIIRLATPYHKALNKTEDGGDEANEHRSVARPSLTRPRGRSELVGAVATGGMCILRATLPRGTPVASMTREVFRVSGISPGTILGMANVNMLSTDVAPRSGYKPRVGGRNLRNQKLTRY